MLERQKMTSEKTPKLTLVSSSEYLEIENNTDTMVQVRTKRKGDVTQPNEGYHTNPMYEKLLKFRELQKKKRFTIEDLLKW